MSKDTWCLSLAKYLELRFHGHSYRRHYSEQEVVCEHSVHRDFVQVFASNGLIAKISYEPIEIWEIMLPLMSIRLKHLKDLNKEQVLKDVKSFAINGYEVYAQIHDQIAEISPDNEKLKLQLNQDQLAFKTRVEVVQTRLTEPVLNNYEINDAMLMVKRTLCEGIEAWGPRLHEAALQAKALTSKSEAAAAVDSATICTEDLQSDMSSQGGGSSQMGGQTESESDDEETSNFRSKLSSTDSKEAGAPTTSNNKKTIKQLLAPFLASNSTANIIETPVPLQEHHSLPLGLFPILVHDQDLSSIIAYSLISHDYNKAILLKQKQHRSDSPNEGEKDEREREKERIKRSHIDIQFADTTTTFSCKIYFAQEFDQLRKKFLSSPLAASNKDSKDSENLKKQDSNRTAASEENIEDVRKAFARSLCRSMKWEARGGKSGSKFSKTIDDQFVLKEMSKTDVGIFENFAPNYFEYIGQCLVQKKPTLLAKIFGVFKITVKKKE